MQGVAAHLEYIGPKERAIRSKCAYYKKNICHNKKSNAFLLKCIGIIGCNYFNEDIEDDDDNLDNNDEVNLNKSNKNISAKKANSLINKKYKLYDYENHEEFEVTFVNECDVDIYDSKISINSNLATALVNANKGEIIEVKTDTKIEKYKVMLINGK